MENNNKQQKTPRTKKKTSHKRRWIIGIIIAVLLCGGAAGAWYVYQINKNNAGKNGNTAASREAIASDARKLIEKKDYNGAVNLVTSQKNYKDDPNLAAAYADALAAKGEVDKAVAVFSELEKIGDQPYYYRSQAARVLANAGRKTEAIAYYEQAIKLAQVVPTAGNDEKAFTIDNAISDYKWYINELNK